MKTQKNVAVGDRPTNEELVQRLQEGDTSAAEELLRQNSGYLTALAKQYDRMVCGPSLGEDLKQEGALALLKAAEQFDPTLGNRFLTYATPVIQAAMRDCAARSALPLTILSGQYHQLRQVLRFMAEDEKSIGSGIALTHRREVAGLGARGTVSAAGEPDAVPKLRLG